MPLAADRAVCDKAGAIFTMAPLYTRRLLIDFGEDLAARTYPFTRPVSFSHAEYCVADPGWDSRPAGEVARAYAWFRERVLVIRLALAGLAPGPWCPRRSTWTCSPG